MALDDVMEFPAKFTLKVIGGSEPDFPSLVVSTIRALASDASEPDIRPSSKGTFVSVNVTFTATSVTHLESVHTALNATGRVKYII